MIPRTPLPEGDDLAKVTGWLLTSWPSPDKDKVSQDGDHRLTSPGP